MSPKNTLPISQARKEIFKIADKVQKPSNYYTLTEKGKPKAVVISAEEFDSWQETLEVIKDFPNLEKEAKRAEKDLEKGNFSSLEEVLAEEGFIFSKKQSKNVSNSFSKKGGKRHK